MNFLLDECVLGKTKRLLKELGFSIISLSELGKNSSSDEDVLDLAKKQEAILITNDLHFSNIVLYPVGSHLGIILLRFRASETPDEIVKVHRVLELLLKERRLSELKSNLTVIDRNKYRIHKE